MDKKNIIARHLFKWLNAPIAHKRNYLKSLGVPLVYRIKLYNAVVTIKFFIKKINRVCIRNDGEFKTSKKFAQYYFENSRHFDTLLADLKRGMEAESQRLAQIYIDRQLHIFENNVIDLRQFEKSELISRKKISEKRHASLYPSIAYDESCAEYHNGLTLLAKSTLEYIG